VRRNTRGHGKEQNPGELVGRKQSDTGEKKVVRGGDAGVPPQYGMFEKPGGGAQLGTSATEPWKERNKVGVCVRH